MLEVRKVRSVSLAPADRPPWGNGTILEWLDKLTADCPVSDQCYARPGHRDRGSFLRVPRAGGASAGDP